MLHRILTILWHPVSTLFHYCTYTLGGFRQTQWMGVPILKLPSDLWLYQEILWETSPTLMIETGTNRGASALFFAHLFDLMGHDGRVITVDITRNPEGYPEHPRITYLTGSSTAPEILETIRAQIRPTDRVMVSLDSDHAEAHVTRELELYAPLVSPDTYLVVEDSNVNGHPVNRIHGPGPMEALRRFLTSPEGRDFTSDDARVEKFGFTFHPHGWLRRHRLAL